MQELRAHIQSVFFVVTTALLLLGMTLHRLAPGTSGAPDVVWASSAGLGLIVSIGWVVVAARRREPSVDLIAVLALGGSLLVGEPLAGAVIAWMLATGRVLEERAQARAHRELSLLVERSPRTARRRTEGADDGFLIMEVPVEDVARGDILVVGPGEVVPVDGRLLEPAVFDESALTGEALPVERAPGEDARSGAVNAGQPTTLIATALAADSTYARIVGLVEQAQASSAPFVRTADRFAVLFVPLTLVLAGAAWWLSGDGVRAVAVLVVATPCPLVLAAPIAIMSGLSRAAKVGVIIKGGGALERLAAGKVLLFDKTGTLTRGRPVVVDVVAAGDPLDRDPLGTGVGPDELLRLAASLDQVSPHVLADSIVTAARSRGLVLELPQGVVERSGYGVEGTVAGRRVRLGKAAWILGGPGAVQQDGRHDTQPVGPGSGVVPAWARRVRRRAALDGSLTVFAAVDGVPAGALLLEDPIRADAPRMVRALRRAGLSRMVLVTGDRADIAESVGRIVGVDAVHADRDPEEKLAVVQAESHHGLTIMVGDGVNDAPSLAAAGVGVALAARGSTASSQAADVVLTVDRIDRLADAIHIARRSQRIALQSVVLGMGLSLLAMAAAAAGLLPPTEGALLQEGIDVLAITAALRAVLPGRQHTTTLSAADLELIGGLHAEHTGVLPVVERVRAVADALAGPEPRLAPVQALLTRLDTELLPHERAEEHLLYPVVGRLLGGDDPTGAMSRSHAEIEHQVARLRRLIEDAAGSDPAGAPDPRDVVEVQHLLYGLYAVLRLHNAQEEEGMFSLLPSA